MRYAVVLVVALSSGAVAQDWRTTDTTLLASAIGLLVVDWGQTRDLATRVSTVPRCTSSTGHCVEGRIDADGRIIELPPRQRRVYAESNPFLGEHPTRSEVDRYFLLAIAGTTGLAYILPQKPRRWFLGGVIVLEAVVIYDNHSAGLRVSF